jgi:hypothetical protein
LVTLRPTQQITHPGRQIRAVHLPLTVVHLVSQVIARRSKELGSELLHQKHPLEGLLDRWEGLEEDRRPELARQTKVGFDLDGTAPSAGRAADPEPDLAEATR